jgi:hypothetical protein
MSHPCKSNADCINPKCKFFHRGRKMIGFVEDRELINKYTALSNIRNEEYRNDPVLAISGSPTLSYKWTSIDNSGTKLMDDCFAMTDKLFMITIADPTRILEDPKYASILSRIKSVGYTYYGSGGSTRLLDLSSENALSFKIGLPTAAFVLSFDIAGGAISFSGPRFTREIIQLEKSYTFEEATAEISQAGSFLNKVASTLCLGEGFYSERNIPSASFVKMATFTGFAIKNATNLLGRNLLKNILDIFDCTATQAIATRGQNQNAPGQQKTIRYEKKDLVPSVNAARPYRLNNFGDTAKCDVIYTDAPLTGLQYLKFTSPLRDIGCFTNLCVLFGLKFELSTEEFEHYQMLVIREQSLDAVTDLALNKYKELPSCYMIG